MTDSREEVRSLREWLDLYKVKLVLAIGFRPHPDQDHHPLDNPDPKADTLVLTREEFEIQLVYCKVDYDCGIGYTVSGLSFKKDGREFGLPYHNYDGDILDVRQAEDTARLTIQEGYGAQGISLLVAGVVMGNVTALDLKRPWPEGRGIFTIVGLFADTLERRCDCVVADNPSEAVQALVARDRKDGRRLIVTGVFAGKREIEDRYAIYADDPDDLSDRPIREEPPDRSVEPPAEPPRYHEAPALTENFVDHPAPLGIGPHGPYFGLIDGAIPVYEYYRNDPECPVTGYGAFNEPLGPNGSPYLW